MRQDDFADIDTRTPSAARGYDYMLGGTDNYAVDRMAIDQMEQMLPGTKAAARNNRRFLERVVRYLAADCGIRQFIDNGSGLPTRNNVHSIAQDVAPESRIVYVDNDPVVLRHQKVNALAENENTAFVLADARDTEGILRHRETTRLIDFGQPTAVLYILFLHLIRDEDDPAGLIRRMTDRLAPGSYVVISQPVADDPEVRERITEFWRGALGDRFGRVRDRHEVEAFFDGLELVEPGLVNVADWRPDGEAEEQGNRMIVVGGVARKPA